MAFVLGLTGSIGMGKTTTAAMFANLGIPVWDADAAVHRLYARGGKAVPAIASEFPDVIENSAVSRPALRQRIAADPTALSAVQAIVHPLVALDRQDFLRKTRAKIVVLDVPLLFETGTDALCNAVAVVSAPQDIQRARVLARGSISAQEFETLLSRQMPDDAKRARARWVIETTDMALARAAVAAIIAQINQDLSDA